jgi:Dullard-like phosphatase family protein
MAGRGNISNLEINNVNNLNSSFDSMIKNYGANNSLMYNVNLNSSFYNNGKSNTNLFNGRITNTPFINPDNISSLNINNFNTNNSILNNMRHQQLLNYEPNSSFSYGYNNALASNLLNNSFLGINNLNNNSFQRSNDYSYSSINIEDLLVLEEKLSEIIITLNKTKIVYNECFEFWNYYYNCSLYGCLEKLFTNIYESNNVKLSINYLLMSIIICYDFSFDMNIINNAYSVLDELLKLNHQNLIIIFEHILTKVSSDSRDNIWVFKLHGIVNSSKNSIRNNKFSSINEYSMSTVEKITYNTGIIIQNIRVLLKNYDSPKIKNLTSIFKKLNEKTYEDINAFFRECILRVDNMNGSVLASIFLKENNNFKTEPAPYLKTINRKPYSLILDLDETLVHFKVNPQNESEGVLRVRPGIIEFLDSIDKYYELIIFTAATQEYADLLIDAVEENKIYFEHRLYRQHTVIIDNDFVKDLSRVGRPLDKIAIVDNMPQNFRLQKENGINIKAFWGEEVYDTALIDLAPILINIAKEGGDIRDGLAKYKDEIVKKVTSNISKHTPS